MNNQQPNPFTFTGQELPPPKPFATVSVPIGFFNPDVSITVKKKNKKTGVVTKWKVPHGRCHVVLSAQEFPAKKKFIQYRSRECVNFDGDIVTPPPPRVFIPEAVPGAPRKRTYSRLDLNAEDTEEYFEEEEPPRKVGKFAIASSQPAEQDEKLIFTKEQQ